MRAFNRKGIAGAIGLALMASACGVLDDNDATDDTQTGASGAVTIGGCVPQSALIPSATNHACGGNLLQPIFSMLVRYDGETGEAIDEIAESIETEDNQVWNITLRPGWTFHDGTPVTAGSFVNAWNWAADGDNAELGVNASFFSPIAGYEESQEGADELSGLEIVDDLRFEVTLNQPEAGFPQRLGYTAYAPLPESYYDDPEAFGDHPIGSGPFQVDQWIVNEELHLSVYEGYQGTTKPRVENVTFQIFQEQEAEYANLLGDRVDVMVQLPGMALAGEAYRSDLGDRFVESEAGSLSFIAFPPESTDGDVADPRFRQAISMAINRQLIIDNIFQGVRTPAHGWVSPVVGGYVPEQCGEFCSYNPERAQELLDESGFEGTVTLTYNADDDHQAWVRAVCNSITNTLDGVECQPDERATGAEYFDELYDFEMEGMFRLTWNMDYPSIENFLEPLYSTGASANFYGYSESEFDDLLAQAAQEQDTAAFELYQQAERLLAEEMPTIPLWYDKTVTGYSTKVEPGTVQITPFRTVDLLTIATR
jgi:oligopeptide transport system substrate-binding protein